MIRQFALLILLLSTSPSFAQQAPAQKPSSEDQDAKPKGGVFRVGGAVSPPKAVFSPEPQCTDRARATKQQGTETLWGIVGVDGVPRDLHVATSLGSDLDQRAIETVLTWIFEPAEKDGKPVAVQVNFQVKFDCRESQDALQKKGLEQDSASLNNPRPYKSSQLGNVQVLTDTQGVNFGPYLADLIKKIRQNWFSLIPKSAYPPLRQKGKVVIEFQIMPDGLVSGLKYVSSSGDDALDRAAYNGIVRSSPLAALPPNFAGPNLTLRFTFFYNADPSESRATQGPSRLPTPLILFSHAWQRKRAQSYYLSS